MHLRKKKPNKKGKAIFILLLLVCNFAILPIAFSQQQALDSASSILNNSDTVLVYKNSRCFLAKVVASSGKKILVKALDSANTKKPTKIPKKFVFHPISKNNPAIPKILRFRQMDPLLADELIMKGTVIGFNKQHFILEYTYNHRTEIAVKHTSEIVQRDLGN